MIDQTRVSVVLPAYNEEDTIRDAVEKTRHTLNNFLPSGNFEIIIAEDGCDDRTPEIAEEIAKDSDSVSHFHSDERLGRGEALNKAFDMSSGDVLAYIDSDLATDMSYLEQLVESIRSDEYDVATGSRWIPGHKAERPSERAIPSLGYNFLVRFFLGSQIRDHQAGFKAIDREVFNELCDNITDEHWFWDTELLVKAQEKGYRVKEFPVEWSPQGDSKVDLVRDILGMGSQLGRVFWELRVHPYANKSTGMISGFSLSVIALGLMFIYLDPRKVLSAMSRADPVLLVVSAIVFLISWPVRGIRYRSILRNFDYDEKLDLLTGAIFISQMANLVFPFRLGDGARPYVLKTRRKVSYMSGFASIAVERIFDLVIIVALALVAIFSLRLLIPGSYSNLFNTIANGVGISNEEQFVAQVAIGAAIVVTLLTICVGLATLHSHSWNQATTRRLIRWISDDSYVEYVVEKVWKFVSEIQNISRQDAIYISLITIFVWLFNLLPTIFVFKAVGVNISIFMIFIVSIISVNIGELSKVLPLSPGGTGLYEATFTVFVVGLTPVAPATAFAIALIDHGLKHLVTISGGLMSLISLNISLVQAVEVKDESTVESEEI